MAVGRTQVAAVVFILPALPLLAALMSRVALGAPISRRVQVTLPIIAAGIALIDYGSGHTENASRLGDFLALAAAGAFGVALTVARHLRASALVPAVPIGYLAAAAALAPFAHPLSVPPSSWLFVVLHGGVFIVGSTTLLSLGPRYLPAAEVGLLLLGESILAPLLAWAVLGERPGGWTLIGGAVVLGALAASNAFALARPRAAPRANRPPRPPPPPRP